MRLPQGLVALVFACVIVDLAESAAASVQLTFALPEHRDRQVVVRLHHRSGAYGVVSGAFSGATYLTVGLRSWF